MTPEQLEASLGVKILDQFKALDGTETFFFEGGGYVKQRFDKEGTLIYMELKEGSQWQT